MQTKNFKRLFVFAVLLLFALPIMAADFSLGESLKKFTSEMGFAAFFAGEGWKNFVMIAIGCFLLYLAIKKKYEPLLLLPIAFGMILTNLPGAGLFDSEMWNNEFLKEGGEHYHDYGYIMAHGGLLDFLGRGCNDRLWSAHCQS